MMFSFLDAVLLATVFLFPGLIWDCVLQVFLWRREDRGDRGWIRLLTLGAINSGLWSWLIYLLLVRVEGLARPWMAALAWSFIFSCHRPCWGWSQDSSAVARSSDDS